MSTLVPYQAAMLPDSSRSGFAKNKKPSIGTVEAAQAQFSCASLTGLRDFLRPAFQLSDVVRVNDRFPP